MRLGSSGIAVAFVAFAHLVGCSDDVAPVGDGGTSPDARSDAGVLAPPLPTLPGAATLPTMAPCPEGWREQMDAEDGVVLCEPWPEAGRSDCPPGEAHFPGTDGCAPLGAPCPAGEWPTDLPAGVRVLYVRAGASGTGTMASPFGTVDAAYAVAFAGDVIALAKGTYRRVPLGKNIEVVGACAAETHIVPSSSDDWAVLAMGADSTLRNVTIGPTSGLAVVVSQADTTLTFRGVEVRDATGGAIVVGLGSRAVLERVRVVGPGLDAEARGIGLNVQEDATVTVDQAVFEGAAEASMKVTGGGNLTLSRVASWGTAAARGQCLEADQGGVVTSSALVCEDQARIAVLSGTGGATLDLTHLVIRRVAPLDGGFGRGFAAQGLADVRVSKVFIEEATQMAILLGDADPTIPATGIYEDVFIRDTQLDADELYGGGLILNGDARATVDRLAIIDSHFDSFVVQNGAEVDARDVTLRGSTSSPAGGNGAALYVAGGSGSIERLDIRESSVAGVVLEEASLSLIDASVHETLPGINGRSGFGLLALEASQLEAERLLVEGSHTAQISLQDWSTGRFVDLTIRDGQVQQLDGKAGVGLQAVTGSSFDVTRALVERNRSFGVLVVGSFGTPSALRDVTILETSANDCADCAGYGSGLGVFQAQVSVHGFSFRDNRLCGVHLGDGGAADLVMGEVVNSAVGVCVADEAFDLTRLQSGVEYRDNGTNLDASGLPVPEIPPSPDFMRQ